MKLFTGFQWIIVGFFALILVSVLFSLYNLIVNRYSPENQSRRDGIEHLASLALVKASMKCYPQSADYAACKMKASRMVSNCGFNADIKHESVESETNPDPALYALLGSYAIINQADGIPDADLTISAVTSKDVVPGKEYLEPRSPTIHREMNSSVFAHFDLSAFESLSGNPSESKILPSDFDWRALPDKKILKGDITSVGYRQLYRIAELYRTDYLGLLTTRPLLSRKNEKNSSKAAVDPIPNQRLLDENNLCNNNFVSVSSTPSFTSRQSAAIFMSQLCQPLNKYIPYKGRAFSPPIVFSTEKGLEESSIKKCSRAMKYANVQALASKNKKMTDAEKVLRLYFRNLTAQQLEDVTEISISNFCHGEKLPCSTRPTKDDPCLKIAHLEAYVLHLDGINREKIRGKLGGYNATRLSVYPQLSKIKTFMEGIKSSAGSSQEVSNSRLVFLFTHTSTMLSQKLLIALNTQGIIFQRPPLAERLVFQLWQGREMDRTADDDEESSLRGYSNKHKSHQSYDYHFHSGQYYVRVLYRGFDVTADIPSCHAEMTEFNRFSRPMGMCSLRAFFSQIDSILVPHLSYDQACQ